jgi:hypothetical protein
VGVPGADGDGDAVGVSLPDLTAAGLGPATGAGDRDGGWAGAQGDLRPIPWLEEEGPLDPGCRVSHRRQWGRLWEMTLVVSGAGA